MTSLWRLSSSLLSFIVTAGGHIANVGVHGKPVQLNLDKLWSHKVMSAPASLTVVGFLRLIDFDPDQNGFNPGH
jgi:hypothetical protein